SHIGIRHRWATTRSCGRSRASTGATNWGATGTSSAGGASARARRRRRHRSRPPRRRRLLPARPRTENDFTQSSRRRSAGLRARVTGNGGCTAEGGGEPAVRAPPVWRDLDARVAHRRRSGPAGARSDAAAPRRRRGRGRKGAGAGGGAAADAGAGWIAGGAGGDRKSVVEGREGWGG